MNNALEQTIEDSGAVTPVTLDSARIGSWLNRDDQITRSLHGEISVFRIWNIITDGQDICPPAQTAGLIASYVFGHSGDTLLDLSGNSYDGLIHVSAAPLTSSPEASKMSHKQDADWSNELPPSQQCQRQGFGGYFDGDQDYVQIPQLRGADGQAKTTFDSLSVDLWVKFLDMTGNHPVLMEDGFEPGALHLQTSKTPTLSRFVVLPVSLTKHRCYSQRQVPIYDQRAHADHERLPLPLAA